MHVIPPQKKKKNRCKIDECDNAAEPIKLYQPHWLEYAVPHKNGVPSKCTKYQSITNECTNASDFNTSIIVNCNNEFIYSSSEVTIVNEVE